MKATRAHRDVDQNASQWISTELKHDRADRDHASLKKLQFSYKSRKGVPRASKCISGVTRIFSFVG